MTLLFIGNSFTGRNNLPGLIAGLAAAGTPAVQIDHELISAGGASLRQHWNAPAARAAIEAGGYDAVVLQEQSTLPVKNAARMHDNVRLFHEAIARAGSRTILYMTWARRNAPEAQQTIADAYTSIGRELGATVVPAGLAWQAFLRAYDRPVLHDPDQSHPTRAGSYLAACVFYGVLFGRSPVGLAGGGVDLEADDVTRLQQVAWETVQAWT